MLKHPTIIAFVLLGGLVNTYSQDQTTIDSLEKNRGGSFLAIVQIDVSIYGQ
jgi:hypothetical protein